MVASKAVRMHFLYALRGCVHTHAEDGMNYSRTKLLHAHTFLTLVPSLPALSVWVQESSSAHQAARKLRTKTRSQKLPVRLQRRLSIMIARLRSSHGHIVRTTCATTRWVSGTAPKAATAMRRLHHHHTTTVGASCLPAPGGTQLRFRFR